MAFDVRTAFRGNQAGNQTQSRMVAELGVWASLVDGDLDESELQALAAVVNNIPGLESFGIDDLRAMLEEMNARYSAPDKMRARVFEIVGSIRDADLRRKAYQLSCLCAAANGDLSQEEAEFLAGVQLHLEISDGDAQALMNEVVQALR